MTFDIDNFKISEPSYFHREYKNDIPKEESGNYYFDQCKRITTVALPFLSLYKPFSFPLSLTLGGLRSFISFSQLLSLIQNGSLKESSYVLLQTILSVIALASTVLAHPLGMLITTVHDCALDSFSIGHNLYVGDFQSAVGSSANLMNNALYLTLFLNGGIEIAIASLAMQILIGLSHSAAEYQKGNYLEASGHLLMGMIRGNQMLAQVQILQMKWKIEHLLNKSYGFNQIGAVKGVSQGQSNIHVETRLQIENHQLSLENASKVIPSDAIKNQNNYECQKLLGDPELQTSQEVIDILIKYGENPFKISALSYAIEKCDFKAATILVKNNANLNVWEKHSLAPTGICVSPMARAISKVSIQNNNDFLIFVSAALDSKKFDINFTEHSNPFGQGVPQGYSLMNHLFYCHNQAPSLFSLTDRLFEKGINVNHTYGQFLKTIILNDPKIYGKITEYLLQKGADTKTIDFSCLPIHYCENSGDLILFIELLRSYAIDFSQPSQSFPNQGISQASALLKNILGSNKSGEFKKNMVNYLLGIGAEI